MVNTPLWKRGARGDFNNVVHIRSFKNLMLDKYDPTAHIHEITYGVTLKLIVEAASRFASIVGSLPATARIAWRS